MDPIQIKLFIEALKKGDTKKAVELLDTVKPETAYTRGYKKALSGIVAAVENSEMNSLFSKMLSGDITKRSIEERRRTSRTMAKEVFRPAFERGYEKAWYDVLSIFLGKKKVGLEKHVKGELS
jgi:hypothetical protein